MTDSTHSENIPDQTKWNPWLALLFALLVFVASQAVGTAAAVIYPTLQGATITGAIVWVQTSVIAQFVYIASAEAFTIGAIYLYLRKYTLRFGAIGLRRPRWRDPLYALMAVPVYYGIYLAAAGLLTSLIPSLNVDQAQQIGFTNVHGTTALIMTFVSLVILPALAEEILFRGFLYTSLKKALTPLAAVLITSAIFAAAHLPEGGAAGPLYIAAIDTFILSLVLIYLREKTGSLWAGITLHAIKNGVAFVALFLLHAH